MLESAALFDQFGETIKPGALETERPISRVRPTRAGGWSGADMTMAGPTSEMICPCSSAQNAGLHFRTRSHHASIQRSEPVWPRQRSSR
jgi:hypothetical protein